MLLVLPGAEAYGDGASFLSSYMFISDGIFPGTAEAYGLYGGG